MEKKVKSNPVYKYPTKHSEGFTNTEIKELLEKYYPEVTIEKLFEKIGVHTGYFKDGESITYHHDVDLGIRLVLENREMKQYEWD